MSTYYVNINKGCKVDNLAMINKMLLIQSSLNEEIAGVEWKYYKTKENREINWYRCIYMEVAEAINSFNWKHWKDIDDEDDLDNLKLELVDIWHFVMSELLIRYNNCDILSINIKILYDIVEKESLVLDPKQMIEILELYMRDILEIIPITSDEILEYKFIRDDSNIDILLKLVTNLFKIWTGLGYDMKDLYLLYIGKYSLNLLRKRHGYKEGKYKKTWDDKEDNEVMMEVISDRANTDPDELYKILEDKYLYYLKDD